MTTTRAWHFIDGNKLRDGRTAPPDGVWLEQEGPLKLCHRGLHWSRHPFDALLNAPGDTLCLVDVGGEIIEVSDKGCSTRRRTIVRMDAKPLLRYFARQQALSVIHLYPGEPAQCVLDYLMGDDSARAAADAAAGAAAGAAADAAAGAAACAAAGAAWAAARTADAAWAAADAARAAAWAAARPAEAARATAWAAWAARAAADTARDPARADFAALVHDAFQDWLA